MSIKNRLSKLEKVAKSGEFCSCKSTSKFQTWRQDLTEDANDHEEHPLSDAVPDFCEQCRKPIEKHKITIQLVDAEYLKTTNCLKQEQTCV